MPTKIAFASCCRIESFPDQPVWADVAAEDPDYLFLLGDQIYMDYGFFGDEPDARPQATSAPSTVQSAQR
mgnify:CR=1 FL=1